MPHRPLSSLEAASLVAGSGLGTGILAIPYAASKVGFMGVAFSVATAFAVSTLLHLLVADLVLHSKHAAQLIGIFREHLFSGRFGRLLTAIFFLILAVVLFLNLTIYMLVASEVISSLSGLSETSIKFLFYGFSSAIVLLGIRIIGISEKFSMVFLGIVVLYLTSLAKWNLQRDLALGFGDPLKAMALYGLCMFSFSALFSVPQVVNHIADKSKIRRSIIAGMGANALITLVFSAAVLTASGQVTKVATIGLSRSMGTASELACALFVLLAMLTSYWSIALAQLEILREQTGLGRAWCWLIATLPTLWMAMVLPAGFIDYIQIAGGSVAVIIGCMVLPAYRVSIRGSEKPLLLGKTGSSAGLPFVLFFFYVIMAASSFIEV